MNLKSDFLTKQIIAYIGNKRRLLPLIEEAIRSVSPEKPEGLKFLDLFAGSGIVSRLGKELNFELYVNDWEHYSSVLSRAFILTNQKDIVKLFGSDENFKTILEELNNTEDPSEDKTYIARYYAPKSLDIRKNNFNTERLFYTRQNALRIDKIRNRIEELFPGEENRRQRDLLLGILLYEAATHTNTSGVFKAYHKGFGGHNGDAIKRIVTPVQMNRPVLTDSDYPVHIFKENANQLVRDLEPVDIAYLDPPYNQHQYGSNYHMLNTIALWDKQPVSGELNEKGILKEKAAIRKDWINTRSDYCYRESAIASFSDLIKNIKAKYILISYSTDGIIPFEKMKEICAEKGLISIVTNQYTKYRGGKQSNSRLNTNIEFVLVIDCGKKNHDKALIKIDNVIQKKQLLLLFRQKYRTEKFLSCKRVELDDDQKLKIDLGTTIFLIETISFFELIPTPEIETLSAKEISLLSSVLNGCVCQTKEEELEEIIKKINENATGTPDKNQKDYFLRLIPDTLKKLAHKKNREKFFYWLNKIKDLKDYPVIEDKIKAIEIIADKRFNN